MIERWTRMMIRHRWIVLGAWLLVFAASVAAASGLSDLLTNRFTLPGTDTKRAEDILEERFGQKSTGSFTLVVESESRSAESLVPATREVAKRAVEELPTSKLAGVQPIAPNVVSANIVSELEPADAKGHTDDMREAVGEIPGATVYVTGQSAIEHDLDPVFAEDLKVGELYIAVPAALVLLVFVFGSLAFLIPFMFAAATIPACLGIVWISPTSPSSRPTCRTWSC
jgi:putative drug exporter of the RND superfamily